MEIVPFWECLGRFGTATALIEGEAGRVWTYAQLEKEVERVAQAFCSRRKQLLFLQLENSCRDVIRYLGGLRSGSAVYIYNKSVAMHQLAELAHRYKPDVICGSPALLMELSHVLSSNWKSCLLFGETVLRAQGDEKPAVHDLLTLLVSTSGSTGTAKLVRLSTKNLQSSAWQICRALHIGQDERAITSVPIGYIYGLSILHSHLTAGASLLVESRSVMDQKLWQSLREFSVTSFSGVPWTYDLLKRTGFDSCRAPSLLRLNTTGAKVRRETREWMKALDRLEVYFMYGQTEASSRITVLSSDLVDTKDGSAGTVVEGGVILPAIDGTLIYHGPNVMLGYANDMHDLALGDVNLGVLDTGDLGRVDADGCLFITGRKSRFSKVFGLRVNLDEVQEIFESFGVEALVVQTLSDRLRVRCTGDITTKEIHDAAAKVCLTLKIPRFAIEIEQVLELKRSTSGKILLHA